MYTSALGYYSGSLDAIKDLMKTNLELKKKEVVKTFNYKYGENYESNAIGKGITAGGKLELVPNFIGQSETIARNWASNNGINIEVIGSGPTIVNQSIPASVLAKSISTITVELGGGQTQQQTEETTNETPADNNEQLVESNEAENILE